MKKQIKLAVILFVAVVLLWGLFWWGVKSFGDFAKTGQLGDSFGTLNSLFAGLTFAGLVATLIIQWQQIRDTQLEQEEDRELRIRLDLYERRFRVYQATVAFIGSVAFASSGGPKQDEVVQYEVARNEASFLFAGDTCLLNYLAELRNQAVNLQSYKAQARDEANPSGEGATQRNKLFEWFHSQHEIARKKFEPHLSFRTDRKPKDQTVA